jgi:hypothetical protein
MTPLLSTDARGSVFILTVFQAKVKWQAYRIEGYRQDLHNILCSVWRHARVQEPGERQEWGTMLFQYAPEKV